MPATIPQTIKVMLVRLLKSWFSSEETGLFGLSTGPIINSRIRLIKHRIREATAGIVIYFTKSKVIVSTVQDAR